jgi:hypothetical protein
MLRGLYNGLAVVCMVVAMSVAVVVLTLSAKGRLSAENCAAMGRMLRGEPLAVEPPASQPSATQPAEGRDASEQVTRNQEMAEMDNLVLQRRLEELNHQRLQLEALQRQVAEERASLREERLAWERAILAAREDKHGESFAKQLKLFEALPPKQVKDILIAMNEDQAANYLTAMKRDMAADVMSRFKSPQEKQFLNRVLDRMRKSP